MKLIIEIKLKIIANDHCLLDIVHLAHEIFLIFLSFHLRDVLFSFEKENENANNNLKRNFQFNFYLI